MVVANLLEPCKLHVTSEDLVTEALRQHAEHLEVHDIDTTNLDPFKLICWLTGKLLLRIDERDLSEARSEARPIIKAVVRLLQENLLLETGEKVKLPDAEETLITQFVVEEYFGDNKHGVGVNGLLLSFHCARVVYNLRAGAESGE